VWVIVCSVKVAGGEADGGDKASAKHVAGALMRHCQGDTTESLPPLRGREDVLAAAWSIYAEQPVGVRREFVMYIPVLGKAPEKSRGVRWMGSAAAVKALVDIFVTDKDPQCRSVAVQLLVRHAPDSMVRIHAKELLDAVQRGAGTVSDDYVMMLLGKTGCDAAKKLLLSGTDSDGAKGEPALSVRNLALAKLGDTGRELEFIKAFEQACNNGRQSKRDDVYAAVRLAGQLGYIGKPGFVMALARQFRNPLHYRVEGSDFRHVMTVRYGIVEALGLVWPDEPTFAFPYADRSAGRQEAYVKVEEWLEAYTGVKWQLPRPAFNEEGATPQFLPW
jgi:hypothetical protein